MKRQVVKQDEADEAFMTAISTFRLRRGTDSEIEAAAKAAFAYAAASGDQLAWALVLQGFIESVGRGEAPPHALMHDLAAAFEKFCLHGSMDRAFGLTDRKPGHTRTLRARQVEKTTAALFEIQRKVFGCTVEEAKARVATMRGVSEATVWRHYKSHQSRVKFDHSD